MRQVLFYIPIPWGKPLPVFGYGLMMTIAFLTGIYLIQRRAQARSLDKDTVINFCLIVIVSGIVGARIFYCIQFRSEMNNLLEIFKLWKGGLVFYGGLVGGILAGGMTCWFWQLRFWQIGDVIGPVLALGIGITRIGCFLNGCCFGPPTSSWIGVRFPVNAEMYNSLRLKAMAQEIGLNEVCPPVHPVQLYAMVGNLMIFGLLLLIERKTRQPEGGVLLLFAILYAIFRFTIEFIRIGNDPVLLGLTISQVISVLFLCVGIPLYIYKLKAQR
jgi:phosphatidylglycerol:prolipoprotein diacylglycerol transferase